MENNLYYTPTIEEFHVGFEYERLWLHIEPPMWGKETFYLNDSHIKLMQYSLSDIEPLARVKYLDQSDIESLRLNGLEITEYVEESHLEFTWFKGIELFGLLTFTDKMISFYEYNYSTREYSDCIFRGTIKNKSELIKLMQQLNIK